MHKAGGAPEEAQTGRVKGGSAGLVLRAHMMPYQTKVISMANVSTRTG